MRGDCETHPQAYLKYAEDGVEAGNEAFLRTTVEIFSQPLPLGGNTTPKPDRKHECVSCPRCGNSFECRANSYRRCDCGKVPLTKDESEAIHLLFADCLCNTCLWQLKEQINIKLAQTRA